MTARLNGIDEFDRGVDARIGFEIKVDNGTKPSAVGEVVYRLYTE
jgi:hypothetical protein